MSLGRQLKICSLQDPVMKKILISATLSLVLLSGWASGRRDLGQGDGLSESLP